MAAYRDRNGRIIRIGAVVASAVTINQARYPEGFVTKICRHHPKDRRFILDGSIGWTYLSDIDPKTVVVITAGTDLRKVAAEFIRDFYDFSERAS